MAIKLILIKPSKPIADVSRIKADMVKAMEDTTQEGVTFMREYPPQVLTKTHYRRTGTLMRSWNKEVSEGADKVEGLIGSNSNMAPYNIYVEGEEGQQSRVMARGGWQTIDKMISIMQPRLVQRVEAILKKLTA